MSTARFPSTEPTALRPPHERGTLRAFGLAALFHLLLIALIAFGVHWKSHPPEAVEAELWSPTVQRAAPRPTAPMERKAPQPQPQPTPAPPPPQPVATPKPQPQDQQADIVLKQQREAALKKQQAQQQALLEKKLEKEQKKLAEEKLRQAEQKKPQEEKQRLAQEKQEQQDKLRQEKLEQQQKLAEQKRQEALKQKKLEQQQAQLAASSRDDYMKQLMKQAGTGAATSTGTAPQSSGPSGTYGPRIAALIKQNTIYPASLLAQISGDPRVSISVTLDTNSGTVLEAKVERSSGVASWDQAALDAINRVHRFPPQSSGEWPRTMIVNAGPRDPG
ncbi:cell envelope integrity protein TolA [Thiomonas intermedia]|uniref:cell envelope integrity protein TolA n=1 Tax=Thiomonas intermedia TaxID=926 RepID=UPI0009A51C21|nr:cell envelope integrity protein TolA [Thiomonas intermedia]